MFTSRFTSLVAVALTGLMSQLLAKRLQAEDLRYNVAQHTG